MDKKVLKLLIEKSLTGNRLDDKKIMTIADQLTRKQLKIYVDGLKKWVKTHTIIVETAGKLSELAKKEIQAMYPEKEIAYVIKPELIVGIRITDNDTIYELNLKDTLEDMQQYVLMK